MSLSRSVMRKTTLFSFIVVAIVTIAFMVCGQDTSGYSTKIETAIQRLHDDLGAIKAHDHRTRASIERFHRMNAVQLRLLYQTVGVRGNLDPTFRAAAQAIVDQWQLARNAQAEQTVLLQKWMVRVRSDWFGALPPATQRNRLAQFYWLELGEITMEASGELAALIDEHTRRTQQDLQQAIEQTRRLQLWAGQSQATVEQVAELQVQLVDGFETIARIMQIYLYSFFDYWTALLEGHGQRAVRLVLATQAIEV